MSNSILDQIAILLSSGNSWLRDYEVNALQRFVAELAHSQREMIARQLSSLNLVQRSPDNKVLMFFNCRDQYKKKFDPAMRLPWTSGSEEKHRFEFTTERGELAAGVIFVTEGWLTSMECKKRPDHFIEKAAKIFDVALLNSKS